MISNKQKYINKHEDERGEKIERAGNAGEWSKKKMNEGKRRIYRRRNKKLC